METISSTLLNQIEAYLVARIDVTLDGTPNRAMILLHLLQAERKSDISTDQVPND